MRILPALAALLTVLWAPGLRAATCPAPPSPGNLALWCDAIQGNTCLIDSLQCTVPSGSILDFGDKDVVLRQNTKLDAGTGSMTIMAGSLELQPGTALFARGTDALPKGGSITVHTARGIAILRSGNTLSRIDASAPLLGGSVTLTSDGANVQSDGVVTTQGTNSLDGVGGTIDVSANSVAFSNDVLAGGGTAGVGGLVTMEARAGNLTVAGRVIADGSSGGSVELAADGTVTASGVLDVRATAPAGDGGSVDVFTTNGSVSLSGKVFVQGDVGSDTEGGASGGDVNVFSAGSVTISGTIEVTGSTPDGLGGDIFISSGLDTTQTGTGVILVQGKGLGSEGGTLEFDSHRDLTLGAIDAHGSDILPSSGGDVRATAWCTLTVPTGVIVDALGDNGSIALRAGGQIFASGTLRAGNPIALSYLSTPPTTAGGTFLPELAPFIQDPTLTPCGGVIPLTCGDGTKDDGEQCDDHNNVSCDGCSSACHQEACGNGVVECDEQCDDGNTNSCDGCSSACKIETCGDGVQDCNEQCDDGNTTSCDGCSALCQLEGCGNGVVECGEECESNPPGSGGCSLDCKSFIPPGCGDGVVQVDATHNEECDDGNTADGDGCSHMCREERCGNNIADPGEDCDDGNVDGCDGCSPTCKLEACGNGILDCGEECDDGAANGAPGGHCLPDLCQPAPTCSTATDAACIPCATRSDCDPLDACGSATCESGVCTPVAPPSCDDGDLCNGTETCDPATGCVGGTPLGCDDGDACTTDSCDPATGCASVDLVGFAMPACRLKAARDVVTAATDIAAPARTKLLQKLGGIEGRVLAASQAGANVKKTRKALKGAGRQLQATVRYVTKQRGKKIGASTADAILAALGRLPPLLSGLTP